MKQVSVLAFNTSLPLTFFFFQDALARNSARQIRLAFLLHAWNATLDYSENVLREAEQTDKLFNVSLIIKILVLYLTVLHGNVPSCAARVALIVLATVFSAAWYKIVIHESLVFS